MISVLYDKFFLMGKLYDIFNNWNSCNSCTNN